MARDYNAAIAALNTLQSNFAVVDAIRKSGRSMNKNAIPEMIEWCRRAGYEPPDFNPLNIIHIAGTKGKGSTSAFISSILSQYSNSPHRPRNAPGKIGLYTSPHLRSVRERIQINNKPLSEMLFSRYFFEVWDRLERSSRLPSEELAARCPATATDAKPVYFRYLTLMAFHAFLSEGVDAAVLECGVGGEYDSTNVVDAPVVTAVTSLGIDHVAMLGGTIEEIAWHKGGVFKQSQRTREVFTVAGQPDGATNILKQRAEHEQDASGCKKGLTLQVSPLHREIADGSITLGLAGSFQKSNASLAVAVTAAHLRALNVPHIPAPLSNDSLPPEFRRGLETVQWGGRCETRRDGNVTWYIDGAHTLESIEAAAAWFASQTSRPSAEADALQTPPRAKQRRVLLFNQQTRDAPRLARALHASLSKAVGSCSADPPFTHTIFCTNVTFSPAKLDGEDRDLPKGRYKPDLVSINTNASDVTALKVQRELAEVWGRIDEGKCCCEVKGTVEEAVGWVRRLAGDEGAEDSVEVLVTGSLHLVGGVLEVLGDEAGDEE